MRTQDEVVARIKATREHDVFGWQAEVLLSALDFEHARPWLRDDAKAEDWTCPLSEAEQRAEAVSYLDFAFGKCIDHRGLSAGRSVDKLGAWLWLLGLDHERFDAAGFENYGAPQLVVAAELLGVDIPDDPEFARMAEGLPCEAGCEMGCGE